MTQRLIIGCSGASGGIFGIRLSEVLRAPPEIETHLVATKQAGRAVVFPTVIGIGTSIARGLFRTAGPVPTLSAISTAMAIARCRRARGSSGPRL